MARILLVDDDKDLSETLQDILESKGYQVLPAFNGEDALGLISFNTNIDLIITDIYMPKLNGIELIKQAREINPDVSILAFSGREGSIDLTRTIVLNTAEEFGANEILHKPFSIDEFLAIVKKLLNGAG